MAEKKKHRDEDEITLAKSILDEIVEETEKDCRDEQDQSTDENLRRDEANKDEKAAA